MTAGLSYGYWPNVGYVTFLESARTESGTIEWQSVIGVFGSAEDALDAIAAALNSAAS